MYALGTGFGLLSRIVPIIVVAGFVLVFFIFLREIVRGARERSFNNRSPRLTVPARLIGKRTQVSGGGNAHAHTSYFITFEVDSGDRMELSVAGEDYGMLAEGDVGLLTFQGTRYLGFDRSR